MAGRGDREGARDAGGRGGGRGAQGWGQARPRAAPARAHAPLFRGPAWRPAIPPWSSALSLAGLRTSRSLSASEGRTSGLVFPQIPVGLLNLFPSLARRTVFSRERFQCFPAVGALWVVDVTLGSVFLLSESLALCTVNLRFLQLQQ